MDNNPFTFVEAASGSVENTESTDIENVSTSNHLLLFNGFSERFHRQHEVVLNPNSNLPTTSTNSKRKVENGVGNSRNSSPARNLRRRNPIEDGGILIRENLQTMDISISQQTSQGVLNSGNLSPAHNLRRRNSIEAGDINIRENLQTTNINISQQTSQDDNVTDERLLRRQHRARVREQVRQANARDEESWDKHMTKPYRPILDKNGWRRWPWVRMPWSIEGYDNNAKVVCDYWTYKEMLRRLPKEHPIHRITQLDWVEM